MEHLLPQSECTRSLWEPDGAVTECFFRVPDFLCLYKRMSINLPNCYCIWSFSSSSLDLGSNASCHGHSRAGWCPDPTPSAASWAKVAAFALDRLAQLLHNLEDHFPNCGLLTVYSMGFECDFSTSGKAGMNPIRKSVANESAHMYAGVCSGLVPFSTLRRRDLRSPWLMLHFLMEMH